MVAEVHETHSARSTDTRTNATRESLPGSMKTDIGEVDHPIGGGEDPAAETGIGKEETTTIHIMMTIDTREVEVNIAGNDDAQGRLHCRKVKNDDTEMEIVQMIPVHADAGGESTIDGVVLPAQAVDAIESIVETQIQWKQVLKNHPLGIAVAVTKPKGGTAVAVRLVRNVLQRNPEKRNTERKNGVKAKDAVRPTGRAETNES